MAAALTDPLTRSNRARELTEEGGVVRGGGWGNHGTRRVRAKGQAEAESYTVHELRRPISRRPAAVLACARVGPRASHATRYAARPSLRSR
eukprot:3665991-Prymnesium_polylepis.1